jgi:hypothetical protein
VSPSFCDDWEAERWNGRLTCGSMAFFLTFFMSTWCRLENARRDKIALEVGTQELTVEQKALERELADNVPWFRYTT